MGNKKGLKGEGRRNEKSKRGERVHVRWVILAIPLPGQKQTVLQIVMCDSRPVQSLRRWFLNASVPTHRLQVLTPISVIISIFTPAVPYPQSRILFHPHLSIPSHLHSRPPLYLACHLFTDDIRRYLYRPPLGGPS